MKEDIIAELKEWQESQKNIVDEWKFLVTTALIYLLEREVAK